MNYAIAIDIGGTNTRVALINEAMEGPVVASTKIMR